MPSPMTPRTHVGRRTVVRTAAWSLPYDGSGTQGPGRTNEDDGSFISFANNASTTAPAVITVSYTFT